MHNFKIYQISAVFPINFLINIDSCLNWQGHLCNSRTNEMRELLQFGKEIKKILKKYDIIIL